MHLCRHFGSVTELKGSFGGECIDLSDEVRVSELEEQELWVNHDALRQPNPLEPDTWIVTSKRSKSEFTSRHEVVEAVQGKD